MPAAMQANGIRARRAGEAHGRGRRVLLVVGVQDEDAVQRPHQHRRSTLYSSAGTANIMRMKFAV